MTVATCCCSTRGARNAATSTGFSVKVWNARSGAGWCELSDLPTDYSELTCLAFSPDGKRLGSAWSDGMIRVYDVSGRGLRRPLLAFSAHRQRIHALRFSADGRLLLSSSADGRARLWESSSGRPRLTFAPGDPCVDAEFSADDRRLLVVCPRRVHVFPLDPRPLAARARPRELTGQERAEFGIGQRR